MKSEVVDYLKSEVNKHSNTQRGFHMYFIVYMYQTSLHLWTICNHTTEQVMICILELNIVQR